MDTRNSSHAAVFGRWGLTLSVLCFGRSHERHTEQEPDAFWFVTVAMTFLRARGGGASTDLEQSSTKRFSKCAKSANYRGRVRRESLVRMSLSVTIQNRVQ